MAAPLVMDLSDLNKVWDIRTLEKPGKDEAKRMLERIAKQVQPIMRKRRWKVSLLSEFSPEDRSLLGLNVNGGAEVYLRLRRPDRDWEFLPYEGILDTMLHELSHIVHGPHDSDFYRLWDELRRECEELTAKGITGTGEGFDLPGRRLGGFTRYPPPPPLRQAALAAAEGRIRADSGPKRLGGDGGIMTALSPIQAAAMAAERRMKDDLWCGSRSNGSTLVNSSGRTGNSSVVGLTKLQEMGIWECHLCTLLNQSLSLTCEACGNPRPQIEDSKFKVWTCKFCTLENNIKLDRCSACEQWRYSYGGPHLGT